MKSFVNAFDNLIGEEGGYSNNKKDAGKETYKGISRRFHPEWKGWEIIDSLKEKKGFKKLLNKNEDLNKLTKDFYYNNYWKKFKGDALPYIIAEELLEQSVVLGTWKTAGKNLQTALNLLNLNGKVFEDLVVDGLVGKKTISALNKVNSRRVLTVLNGLEFCRFKESMENRPLNEVFRGWFDRVNFSS